jgi:sialic acid synthase SpsE
MKVKIGNKLVGENEPCFISFEPSVTFDNIREAKLMIKKAADAGCDGIKFQTFVPGDSERMMGKKNISVNFRTASGQKQELVYDALKRRELSESGWGELVKYAKKLKIGFISAPYFPETVNFLSDLKIDALKVSKGDINNVLLIDQMSKTKLPIILDTREKIFDINTAIKICEKNKNQNIIIMHCPSGYPAEDAGVHLSAIPALRKKYCYPIAFADHSPGDFMNYAAIGLGAKMLEKTITTNKKIERVEHFMSLELDELNTFVQNVRSIEKAIGDPKILRKSRVEENARRSFATRIDITKGQIITREMLEFRRPGNAGIPCSDGFKILNKRARSDIKKGQFLQWKMLE